MSTRSKGKRGEDIAVAALEKAGYHITERNWRCAHGELDVIAAHRGDLVFVEVRARADGVDAALESINARKRAKLLRLAQAYLAAHKLDDTPFRIDVVAITLGRYGATTEIIEDALGW
jgi:putative endonuclease